MAQTVNAAVSSILSNPALKDKEKKTLEQLLPQPKVNFDTIICLSLTLAKPGNKKKASNKRIAVLKDTDDFESQSNEPGEDGEVAAGAHTAEIDETADKSALSVSKEVWNSDTFKQIRTLDVTIRKYVQEQTVPAPAIIKSGIYCIPPTKVVEVDAELDGFFGVRDDLIVQFKDEYPAMIEAARIRLHTLFNEAEYPPIEELIKEFRHDRGYLQIGTSQQLKKVSQAIFEREEKKAKERVNEFIEQTEAALVQGAQKIVSELIERLTEPESGGKKKVIKKATVENWREFFAALKERNMTGNKALAEIAKKGMTALEGVSAENLKNSDMERDRVTKLFGEVKSLVAGCVTNAPGRMFDVDDDEDEQPPSTDSTPEESPAESGEGNAPDAPESAPATKKGSKSKKATTQAETSAEPPTEAIGADESATIDDGAG
jgi:hypothetical protein